MEPEHYAAVMEDDTETAAVKGFAADLRDRYIAGYPGATVVCIFIQGDNHMTNLLTMDGSRCKPRPMKNSYSVQIWHGRWPVFAMLHLYFPEVDDVEL